ncbi:DUF2617 family protein [Mycolicibacterium sp. XJ1819]
MPLHQLAVNAVDVSGAGLRLALNAEASTPLVSARLSHPDGGELVLGVLGASHVVTVTGSNELFSEEVSCTARAASKLPERAVAPGYRLHSRTAALTPSRFGSFAARLRTRCEREPGWLGAAFPGDDFALTVLAAEVVGAGWRWQTWHLYPESSGGGTVVYTNSRWRL